LIGRVKVIKKHTFSYKNYKKRIAKTLAIL